MEMKLKYFLIMMILLGIPLILALKTSLTLTSNLPVNATNYTTGQVSLSVAVSPNNNASSCSYKVGYTNGTIRGSVALTNGTNNATWTNSSGFTPEIDSTFGSWHNITYNCTNGTLNYYTHAYFGYDTTTPTVNTETYSVGNYTTGGNNMTFTFNVTDAHSFGCSLQLIHDATESVERVVEGTFIDNASTNNGRCRVTVYPTNFSTRGKYILRDNSTDTLGNTAFGTNQTIHTFKLKTGWNLITITENLTLAGIASLAPNITIVSQYSNPSKSYTTYTVGVATNANVYTNATNATYVYVNEDTTILRTKYTLNTWQNASLTQTTSNSWNQMGVRSRQTLNQTLYNSTGAVFKYDGTLDAGYTGDNITAVSFYNGTSGKYCTAIRGFNYTSCSPAFNVTDITVEEGDSVWILVNQNITLNRGT